MWVDFESPLHLVLILRAIQHFLGRKKTHSKALSIWRLHPRACAGDLRQEGDHTSNVRGATLLFLSMRHRHERHKVTGNTASPVEITSASKYEAAHASATNRRLNDGHDPAPDPLCSIEKAWCSAPGRSRSSFHCTCQKQSTCRVRSHIRRRGIRLLLRLDLLLVVHDPLQHTKLDQFVDDALTKPKRL